MSIGNSIPSVWTPWQGMINSPSPGGRSRSPNRPTIPVSGESAIRMDSPTTVPRVLFTARTVFLCHRIVIRSF